MINAAASYAQRPENMKIVQFYVKEIAHKRNLYKNFNTIALACYQSKRVLYTDISLYPTIFLL